MATTLGVDTDLDSGAGTKTGIEGIDSPYIPTVGTPKLDLTAQRAAPQASGASFDADAAVSGKRGKLAQFARDGVGVMYRWGGTSSNGWDCSGFLQNIYKRVGISIPRVSFQQANSGKQIPLRQLRAGDLVAWDNSSRNRGADHIAIYIGGGRIAEAYQTGKPTRIRKLSRNEGAMGISMAKYLGG